MACWLNISLVIRAALSGTPAMVAKVIYLNDLNNWREVQ
jgi:hypothetical protein